MSQPRHLLIAVAAALAVGGGLGYGVHALSQAPHEPGMHAPDQAPAVSAAAPRGDETGKPIYTCPMHPQVISDKPGQCPICGMTLVLKQTQAPAQTAPAAGDAGRQADLEPGLAAVVLSPRQRVLANVQTEPVKAGSLSRTVETTGTVAYDERRLQRLSAWVDGRVDQLKAAAPGDVIRRGEVIASLYSPDLVSSQQEYLTALATYREMGHSPYPELAESAKSLVDASRQRLRLMGLTGGQLARLEATRKPLVSFPVVSPASGVVLARKVQPGQYVKAGDVLYDLADFSSVWVEAAVFEGDLAVLKPGQRAEVRLTAVPDQVFVGRVAIVEPALDPATRTAKVRVELANPQGVLKPQMYANVRIAVPTGNQHQLTVPASAVIDTGRRHVVYVEVRPNEFVPRSVMVGAKAGDRYPVVQGLTAGEKVAVSGGFLLDASAQMAAPAENGHD